MDHSNLTDLPGRLVPLGIETKVDHPDTVWVHPCYPVVDPAV